MEMNELAEEIFKQAISHQLDDIHLLPIGEEYVFYLRDVNGLKELRKVSTKIAEQFISYLKYQAGMDVGERRRPQSGSLTYDYLLLPILSKKNQWSLDCYIVPKKRMLLSNRQPTFQRIGDY